MSLGISVEQAARPRRRARRRSTRCWASAAAGLAIRYPEITEMQARAIFLAAVEAATPTGKPVTPRGDDPAGRLSTRVRHLADVIRKAGAAVEKDTGAKLTYQIGSRVNYRAQHFAPRRLRSVKKARNFLVRHQRSHADLSRPRVTTRRRSSEHQDQEILEIDPFVSIDQAGVGSWSP